MGAAPLPNFGRVNKESDIFISVHFGNAVQWIILLKSRIDLVSAPPLFLENDAPVILYGPYKRDKGVHTPQE